MKLSFNLASWAQAAAVGPVDAERFLSLEDCSKMASGVAVANSIDTLGLESPVWEHIGSLIRDYGRLPEKSPEKFRLLLEAYFVACFKQAKDAAAAIWAELEGRYTDHSADKAFRRLVERNAEAFCGVSYAVLQQEHVDRFIEAVRTADTIEWEAA